MALPKHLPYRVNPDANRYEYYENHWKRVGMNLLLRHCPHQGQSVLDYGCGRGESVQLFTMAGFRVTGTDVDPECVRLTKQFGDAVPLNPVDPLTQFGPKSFDIVLCFHVLEHVDSPKKTLNELAQIARKYLILAVPNLRYLDRLFERRFDLAQVNEGHLQSWDHWHLRNLAERYCGLELIEWGSDATVLPAISNIANRLFGPKLTIWLETGPFRRMFPYHCLSVLGLFRVK